MHENRDQSYAIEMQMIDASWERVAFISHEEDEPLKLAREMLVDYVVTSPLVGYRLVPITDDELPKEH